MNELYFLLGAYALAGTGISVAVMRQSHTGRDFFLGGGINWVLLAMTYAATTFSAFMMVGLVGLSFVGGVGALLFELVYVGATILFLLTYGRRIWEKAQREQLVSPMELFKENYGPTTVRAASVISLFALVPYTAVQVIGLAVILEGFGITYGAGVIFAVAIIGIWALLGGLRGVALTDALQGIFMLGMAVAAMVWTSQTFQGFELSTFPNQLWTPRFFLNLTLPWAFFALTNPQVLQRVFLLKDPGDLKKMVILFAIFGILYTLLTTGIGFAARFGAETGQFVDPGSRDGVIVALMGRMARTLALPLALSIVFASVSTANSILLTLASMFTSSDKRPTRGRLLILVLTVVVGFFALLRPDELVELSVASSRVLMVFLPLLFGVFHLKQTGPRGGLITLIGGTVLALAIGRFFPQDSSIITFVTVGVLFALGTLWDRKVSSRSVG